MVYDFKRRFFKGILCFLFISIQLPTAFSADDQDNVQKNDRAKLFESCLTKNCEENHICNKDFVCQCQSGYRAFNNTCVPFADENEACERHEDCSLNLLCIHGICRKPFPSNDFLNLANLCLGVTAAVLIVALFSTVIKCILRYDRSRALESHGRRSSSLRMLRRPFQRNESQLRRVMDEKPPSYEECLRVNTGNALVEPPPYLIATEAASSIAGIPNSISPPAGNFPVVNQPCTTPLNVQALCREAYPKSDKGTQTQNSEGVPKTFNVSPKQFPPQ